MIQADRSASFRGYYITFFPFFNINIYDGTVSLHSIRSAALLCQFFPFKNWKYWQNFRIPETLKRHKNLLPAALCGDAV